MSDEDWSRAVLTTLTGNLISCLDDALMALAAHHDNKPGLWLNELEEAFIRRAKGTVLDGADMELEWQSVGMTMAVISSTFQDVRERLIEGQR